MAKAKRIGEGEAHQVGTLSRTESRLDVNSRARRVQRRKEAFNVRSEGLEQVGGVTASGKARDELHSTQFHKILSKRG
jgi:hypothetical protein